VVRSEPFFLSDLCVLCALCGETASFDPGPRGATSRGYGTLVGRARIRAVISRPFLALSRTAGARSLSAVRKRRSAAAHSCDSTRNQPSMADTSPARGEPGERRKNSSITARDWATDPWRAKATASQYRASSARAEVGAACRARLMPAIAPG
jgi:hypothetical protein